MGMPIAHIMTSGMSGMRAAGDLVLRMEFAKSMRLKQAKEFVAKKLSVTPMDLSDEYAMRESEKLGHRCDHIGSRRSKGNSGQAEHREVARARDQLLQEVQGPAEVRGMKLPKPFLFSFRRTENHLSRSFSPFYVHIVPYYTIMIDRVIGFDIVG